MLRKNMKQKINVNILSTKGPIAHKFKNKS